jgi:hypothetical protein
MAPPTKSKSGVCPSLSKVMMSSVLHFPIPVSESGVMLGTALPPGPKEVPASRRAGFGAPSQLRGVWQSLQRPIVATR